jgi:hypothetical protein
MEEEHRSNIKDVIEQCKQLVDEFSTQGNQRLMNFAQILKKDNKEFHDNIEKEFQSVDGKLSQIKD